MLRSEPIEKRRRRASALALVAPVAFASKSDARAGRFALGLLKRALLGAVARRDRNSALLAALVRRFPGIAAFNDLISSVEASGRADQLVALAEAVGVRFAFEGRDNLAAVGTRPVVMFANHPTGGGNVLGLSLLLAEQFPDHRILGNQHMGFLRALSRKMISVSIRSAASRRSTLTRFSRCAATSGPTTRRSAFSRPGITSRIGITGRIADRPWKDAFIRIARHHDALLVPVWFSGRNYSILSSGPHPRRARLSGATG